MTFPQKFHFFKMRNLKRIVDVTFNGLHNTKKSKLPPRIYTFIYKILLFIEEIKFHITKNVEIPHLEIVLTTKCTLKCRDCVNYIPLINNHYTYTLDDFKLDIDKLLTVTSKIHNLLLLGGEPLLIKNLDMFVDYAASKSNIKYIYIF